jgi:hypothetical protein
MNILETTRDPNLFASWFPEYRANFNAWYAFLAAMFAIPMTEDQKLIFQECAGRIEPPTKPVREAWLCVGRRGGKSFILALIAVFIACFLDHRQFLAPGERGTVMIIARDRDQARVVFRFVSAMLRVPLLAQQIERETASSFDLTNGISVEIHTASYRATRGYAAVAVSLDEIAYWPSDNSAEPDYEVINALRPAMAQFPNALLIAASSPYARRGALWTAYQKHFGKENDPVLVWQAPTRRMNPSIPESVITEAEERDPAMRLPNTALNSGPTSRASSTSMR